MTDPFAYADAAQSATTVLGGQDQTITIGGRSSSGSRGAVVVRPASVTFADARPLRFTILDELGRGGMGVVLRAQDPDLHREVAIKLLRHPQDAARRARFMSEAQITGQLEHPNIVPVHECGIDPEDRPWFAMKVVDGRTFGELLAARNADPAVAREWPLGRLVGVLIQACNGMAFAHSRGVIHRDLKPANVMLGNFGEVLVMDWGLGKVLAGSTVEAAIGDGPAASSPVITLDGAVIGTPCYMAPEQARGESDRIGIATDVYALGAMLCELISGRPPVTGSSVEEVVARAGAGQIEIPLRDWQGRRTPRELVAIARRATALDPGLRYADTGALAEDLQRWLDQRAISASDRSLLDQVGKFFLRHRLVSLVSLFAAAALLAASVVGYQAKEGQRRQAVQALATAEMQRQRAEEALVQVEVQRRQAESGRRREQSLATRSEHQSRRVDRGFALANLGQATAAAALGRREVALAILERTASEERDWCWSALRSAIVSPAEPIAGDCVAVCAAPEGFIGVGGSGRVRWIAADGREVRGLDLGRAVLAAEGSADGGLLALALAGGGLRLLDGSSGRSLAHVIGGGVASFVAVCPVGPTLLAGGGDGVRLHLPGRAQPPLDHPVAQVAAVAIGADGGWWASAGASGVELRTAAGSPRLLDGSEGVRVIRAVGDGRTLAGASHRALRLWSMPSGELAMSIPLDDPATAIAANPAASLIALGGTDGVTLWDVESGMPALRLDPGQPITGLVWSIDGATLAALRADGSLRAWRGR